MLCCEHRNIRRLPEPHVNLTGFHRLQQCLRWWSFHSNRLSVVQKSFLGWLWFAAQSAVPETPVHLLWNPLLCNHAHSPPVFRLWHFFVLGFLYFVLSVWLCLDEDDYHHPTSPIYQRCLSLSLFFFSNARSSKPQFKLQIHYKVPKKQKLFQVSTPLLSLFLIQFKSFAWWHLDDLQEWGGLGCSECSAT